MKKLLITVLLGGALLAPGSPFNPYIVDPPDDHGRQRMRSQMEDFNQDMFAPGQPMNPIIIERDERTGRTKIHRQWMDDGRRGGDLWE